MAQQRDLSTIDLDVGESATIHTRIHKGVALLATVEATITVLKAEDGHLTLAVDQDTKTHDDGEQPMGSPAANLLWGSSDVEG